MIGKTSEKKTLESEKMHLPRASRGDQNPLKNHPGAILSAQELADGAQSFQRYEKSLIW